MTRFLSTALFVFALSLSSEAGACSTEADTVEGSAMNAVAYAETAVRWHQIRKVTPAPADDARVRGKQAEAEGLLKRARVLLDKGDYEGALHRAYRVPEILHYQ